VSEAIKLDWREWDRAMVEYSAASHKDLADASNKKLGDVALRAAQIAPRADKGKIRSTGDWHATPWWPKFIQKIIGMGFNIHTRRRVRGVTVQRMKGRVHDVDSTKEEIAAAYGARTYGHDRQSSRSNEDARRVSKKIIGRRLATVGMFRVVFALVASKFGKGVNRVERQGRNYLTFKLATPGNLLASFEIPFKNSKTAWPGGTRPSPSADVQRKVMIGYTILQRAIDIVTIDMDAYTQRKMEETARRYSAK
jgi:hypothetical protein